jgi:hypothetical protein
MFRQIAETVLRKKIYKKDYFLMGRLRIESSPEISLPPCIGAHLGQEIPYWYAQSNFFFSLAQKIFFGKLLRPFVGVNKEFLKFLQF